MMLRDGGKVRGLEPFTDPKAGGCSTLTSAGSIPAQEIIIRFGYGRKSWAGRGLMQSCIPLFIRWMREAGCIFTVH